MFSWPQQNHVMQSFVFLLNYTSWAGYFLPCSFVWTAAGKQANLENQVGVGGYGYPAMVALNVKKGAYAPLRSAFQRDEIM
jgi:hypothetical protein